MLKSPTGRPTVEVVKTHAASPVLPDLVAQLGRQRQLVEYLLFKLLEAQLLLSSDQAAFVPIAMAEIESVLRRIREEEERREELISSLAQDWEIGRASCRERVWIARAAVALNERELQGVD